MPELIQCLWPQDLCPELSLALATLRWYASKMYLHAHLKPAGLEISVDELKRVKVDVPPLHSYTRDEFQNVYRGCLPTDLIPETLKTLVLALVSNDPSAVNPFLDYLLESGPPDLAAHLVRLNEEERKSFPVLTLEEK